MAQWRVDQLHGLFKEKLLEKYKLNIRDLKKAFGKWDKDGNGLLDLSEVQAGISSFMNGVPDRAVADLVAAYDTSSDGKISYEEFLGMLMSKEDISKLAASPRSSGREKERGMTRGEEPRGSRGVPPPPPQNPLSSRRPTSIHDIPPAPPSLAASTMEPSALDLTNPKELEARVQTFLHTLKAQFIKQAAQMRQAGKAGKLGDRLSLSSSVLLEGLARGLVTKAFQQYTGANDGRQRREAAGVELADFSRVLRSFNVPGCPPLRQEVLLFLFGLCEPLNNASNAKIADPEVLACLMFGQPVPTSEMRQLPKPLAAGASAPQAEREIVGAGPFKAMSAKDTVVPPVPLRFISAKSRTSFVAPTSFDPALLTRSNQPPAYDATKHHVFGMSPSLNSGGNLFVVPLPAEKAAAVPAAGGGRGGAEDRHAVPSSSSRRKSDYIDNSCVVYTSAALGVVHDLTTNTQSFFAGHEDDITCIALSQDSRLVATGQAGKRPYICVWEAMPDSATARVQDRPALATIGKGFFERALCAVSFTSDASCVVGIGCDDAHRIGVFDIRSGMLQAEAGCQHGLPPQIRCFKACPSLQYTEYITKNHRGLCDVFCSVGEHHAKLWSFRRAEPGSLTAGTEPVAPSLEYKALSFGPMQGQVTAAKVYNCCEFVPTADKGACDVLVGGSNGVVYGYRRGVCFQSANVIRGGVSHMSLAGDHLVCGGAGGVIRLVDCRTLASVLVVSTSEDPPKSLSRAGGGQVTPRPGSAAQGTQGGAKTILSKPPISIAGGGSGSAASPSDITGLAIVMGVRGKADYAIAATAAGRVVRVDLAGALRSTASQTGRSGGGGDESAAVAVNPLFYYHTGEMWGLSCGSFSGSFSGSRHRFGQRVLVATCGDDRKLCVWDAASRTLMAKATTNAASRCCHFDRTSSFLAVGTQAGTVHVYALLTGSKEGGGVPGGGKGEALSSQARAVGESKALNKLNFRLQELVYRRDFREGVSDVKFSPLDDKLAAASSDDTICVYTCSAGSTSTSDGMGVTASLTPLHRLRGHSSYITHLDWTADGQLLRSTCGAYELLFWDVAAGRQYNLPTSDCRWRSETCTLGFAVMGIWPPYSDGTDINAVDCQKDLGLVVTGDDFGSAKVFNYPCVVKNAPHKLCSGHSSHVTNVRFLGTAVGASGAGTGAFATIGGKDAALVLWSITPGIEQTGPRKKDYAQRL